MPSRPQLKTSGAGASAMPFASYAQVLRMLMPPAQRVGFYDTRGRTLWVSDGVEEPEFRMHLDLVLARFVSHAADASIGAYSATDLAEPIYVFPIWDESHALLGAVGLLCRELPADTAYRRPEHVERLLAPLLDIIGHSWRAEFAAPVAPQPPPEPEYKINPIIAPAPTPQTDSPLPALLRRSLALGTRSLNAAFGAVIAAERPFTLTHRVSPDESDLAINAALDNVRASVLRYMTIRSGPLVSNLAGSGRTQQLPYKVLALPLRTGDSQLAAAFIVFRAKHAPDFGGEELTLLAQIAGQIPPHLLSTLLNPRSQATQPPAVTQATVARPSAPVPKKAVPATLIPAAQQAPMPARPKSAAPAAAPAATTPPPPAKVVRISAARSAMTLDEQIRAALREDNFDLYVQKIAPLRDSQRAIRYEVLLRMTDGVQLYTPAMFFGAAEANELMPDVDQWVIRELMSTLRRRAVALRTKCWEFAVNISAQTLLTDHFSEYLVNELRNSSIPAGLLVFEVAESDAIEHQYSLTILAKRLQEVGCRLALDNCRAGLRTFDSARKWSVSCVKIDGSLIRHIVTNFRYETQVRAVADMAHQLGIETVAECVESEIVRDRLIGLGVDYAQGFHFGKPQPLRTLFRD